MKSAEFQEYIAYEKIKKYSPVFLFHCSKNDKNYVYVSQNLAQLDKGQPYVIGVCINSPGKGKIAKVFIKGTTKVRYFGSYPTTNLNVYVAKSYNDIPLIGIVSGLEKGIVPVNYQNSFILKVGTIYPIKCGKADKEVKERLVNINLDVNNESHDLYNIYTFDLLPKDNISGRDFSYYQIGQDLNLGLNNPIVKSKFNLLLEAYKKQEPLKGICFAIDQYCQALYDAIPAPFDKQYFTRLSVSISNGQTVFDSLNTLKIYNYNTNDTQYITLIPNQLDKNKFPLYGSLINSAYWSYVNVNDSNNNGFLGSPFNFPVGGVSESAQAGVNGIGIASRYNSFLDSYFYNIAYYIGITDSYNKNNGEGLIIKLGWIFKK